jgi:hypothetical protein
MNPVSRFIYWNMNYHVEHHMFPMVPYHALPKLHELIKHDLPTPQPVHVEAYRRDVARAEAAASLRGLFPETRPAADRQALPRGLPQYLPGMMRRRGIRIRHADGSTPAPRTDIDKEDVIRFDHGRQDLRHLPLAGRWQVSSRPPVCAPMRTSISATGS